MYCMRGRGHIGRVWVLDIAYWWQHWSVSVWVLFWRGGLLAMVDVCLSAWLLGFRYWPLALGRGVASGLLWITVNGTRC